MEKELKEKVSKILTKESDISKICEEFKIDEIEVLGLVSKLKQEGELIDVFDGKIVKLKKPELSYQVYKLPKGIKTHKILLISDTHLGNVHDRLDLLAHIYKEADKKGVEIALHSGDVCDGRSSRPETWYELRKDCQSYDGQTDYIIKNYPRFKGKTYAIAGNHEAMWYKQNGSEILRNVARERDDFVYLGADVGLLDLDGIKVRLYHGSGGGSYARSYKVQKYLDSISPEERPDILQTGHIHQSFYMQQGFTHVFQTGCLEDTTDFIRSKGLSNEKSVWWVDIDTDKDNNVISIKPELEVFKKDKAKVYSKVFKRSR